MTIETRFVDDWPYYQHWANNWHAADLKGLPVPNSSLFDTSKAVRQKEMSRSEGMHTAAEGS